MPDFGRRSTANRFHHFHSREEQKGRLSPDPRRCSHRDNQMSEPLSHPTIAIKERRKPEDLASVESVESVFPYYALPNVEVSLAARTGDEGGDACRLTSHRRRT